MSEYDDFFYPDEEEHKESKISKWVKGLVAAAIVVGLVYISGIYQASFFNRTSREAVMQTQEAVTAKEQITLPIRVFVVRSEGGLGSERDNADIAQLVDNANAIWTQASVSLEVVGVSILERSDEEIREFWESPGESVRSVSGYDERYINVFLVRSLLGINGVAFGGLRSTAVADFTAGNDFRTFAHEIGHLLGLGHTKSSNMLMTQGVPGVSLSMEEISRAQQEAERLLASHDLEL